MLSQVIKLSTVDGGCTDFSRVLKLRNRKWGPTGTLWGPNGDPKTEKVPMGTWGPIWEQWYCRASLGSPLNLSVKWTILLTILFPRRCWVDNLHWQAIEFNQTQGLAIFYGKYKYMSLISNTVPVSFFYTGWSGIVMDIKWPKIWIPTGKERLQFH